MIVKIGNKEVQLTDYLSANQIQKALYEAYQQGRADEIDKIYKMMLLGCDELKCEECAYEQYSQEVCQQAFTIGMIEKYIVEQLKEKNK